MKTPASLLRRLQSAPDAEAWKRFVQLYLPLICYWGRQVGLQDSDVSDLAQEVFTLLLQKIGTFRCDQGRSFRHWLHTVTLNKQRELYRRRGLPAAEPGDLADLPAEPPAREPWEEEHTCYLATRALQLMQADFDPKTWRACWETTVEGRAAGEVAEELGLTVGAVYAGKSRVLRRLRQELQDLL